MWDNFFDTAEIYPSPCFEKHMVLLKKLLEIGLKKKKIVIKLF